METIENVLQSYRRCLRHGNFFTVFYSYFLEQDDKIEAMFSDVDWYKQKQLIERAVKHAILYAKERDMPMVNQLMSTLAKSHSKAHLNVKPEWYPIWLDSMVEAVSLCDPKYTAKLGMQWREVLMPAIDLFISLYERK